MILRAVGHGASAEAVTFLVTRETTTHGVAADVHLLAGLEMSDCDRSTQLETIQVVDAIFAQVAKHNQAKFRALANMGDVLIKMNNLEEAIKVYQKQLTLSKQIQDKAFEASSYGSLGVCHRLLKRFDKFLYILTNSYKL